MRIVFFGTPDYVIPVLEKINLKLRNKKGESPFVAIVTQKPKPTGRKQEIDYSPVDTWAHKRGLPIFFNPKDLLVENVTADIAILASFGMLIPEGVIKLFTHGILNVHPSLLPKWRGAAPVQATITTGDQAGVTIIKIDTQLDHGPIVTQFKDEVLPDDTTASLRSRLFARSADVLANLILPFTEGKINIKAQNHKEATSTRQIQKEDAFIPPHILSAAINPKEPAASEDWQVSFIDNFHPKPSPQMLHNFIRAMQPWPEAWTHVKLSPTTPSPKRLKIIRSHLSEDNLLLNIDLVRLEGKTEVSWKQFKEGYPNFSLD